MNPFDAQSLSAADADPTLRDKGASPSGATPAAPLAAATLWIGAIGCSAAALLVAVGPWRSGQGHALAAAFAALAWLAAVGTRLSPHRQGLALAALLATVTVLLAWVGGSLGLGFATPGLSLVGLLVCVLCAAAGWRAGVFLAAVAVLSLLCIAVFVPPLGNPAGHADAAPRQGAVFASLELGSHLIGIAAGLAAGSLISQLMGRALSAAREREQRFRNLLALAADAYWEIDARYRITALVGHRASAHLAQAPPELGSVPWELASFDADADTVDELQADLDTRVPFRDRPVRWKHGDGHTRHGLVSGAPQFDARGVFIGYWGVLRDVTDDQAARAAVAVTETRYQDLFSSIPTPLVLHRMGAVLDANPAAVTLFGHADLNAMLGTDVLTAYEGGDSRERARRRFEALYAQPLGTALPVTDFKLRVGERAIAVRATSVSVQAEGGAALLGIYVDDTERLAAEQAVRRSEAMLSHLVATSPELITVIDISTGRYAMVNRSFERISGWSAADAVGRTSAEIGLWRDPAEREALHEILRRDGRFDERPVTLIDRAGRPLSLRMSAARFVMERREYAVVNGRDVTEAEQQRLQREAILDNASIGIAVTRDRRFVLVNRHFEQMLGQDAGELLGQPASVMWAGEQDPAELDEGVGPQLARGEPLEAERIAVRKDGSRLTVRLRGCAIDTEHAPGSDTVWIVEDVTERRQFQQALARARDEAEAASRAKSAFLANTSHELRTPINGLIGLARLARESDIDEGLRHDYLGQIVESAQALAATISDILDLSKIEAGKLVLEPHAFDLGAVLRSLHALHAPQARAQGLQLKFVLDPAADGVVLGDALRLRQIVGNFLGNALKFTAHGHIELRVVRLPEPRTDHVCLQVHDTGLGIDAITQARLFKPFTQADASVTRRYGGTGLGLSICHELATLMGGSVGVRSVPGDGSEFWAELPLPPSTLAPHPQQPAPFDPAGLEDLHVLMVEDNAVNRVIAVAMLERWGVQVTQACDGAEALAMFREQAEAGQAFDAVLMDVQMPVMGGHDATRAIRDSKGGQSVPIIALTAAALVSERDAALRAGMNDFLTKPIDAARLHAALLQWCAPARQ